MKAAALAGRLLFALALARLMLAEPAQALTCLDVDLCVLPCILHLIGVTPVPSPQCCDGIRKLMALDTTADRQFACSCAKEAAAWFPELKEDAVRDLPDKCGVPLPVPIDLDFDCSKIPK